MTIFFTVLAGVLTFVLGQFFLRLLVEPVHEFKRTIADIAVAIIQHANIYCNPGLSGKEKEDEVARELRSLASRLNAQMYLVPLYSALQKLFGLPSKSDVSSVTRHLIGISNSVHIGAERMATVNGEKADKICDLLDIHMAEEDRS